MPRALCTRTRNHHTHLKITPVSLFIKYIYNTKIKTDVACLRGRGNFEQLYPKIEAHSGLKSDDCPIANDCFWFGDIFQPCTALGFQPLRAFTQAIKTTGYLSTAARHGVSFSIKCSLDEALATIKVGTLGLWRAALGLGTFGLSTSICDDVCNKKKGISTG